MQPQRSEVSVRVWAKSAREFDDVPFSLSENVASFRRLASVAAVACLWFCGSVYGQSPRESFESVSAGAAVARDHGDVPTAIQLYAQALALNSQWRDGWWFLGMLQYGANQYPAARDALTHFIELSRNAGPALALRGLCEFETGQYPESLQDIEAGVGLGAASQPRNASILFYHEALLLTQSARFEEAVSKYTELVKQGNDNDDLTTGIGLAALRLPVFPAKVDSSQSQVVSMVGRAVISFMSGHVAAANVAFHQVFQSFPHTPNVHYTYGYLLFPTQPDQAVEQFQQELAVAPSSAVAHAMLAWTYGLRGDFVNAMPNAQKAASEDPSLTIGQLVLGRTLIETGDLTGGLPYLEKVLQREPGNLEAHITIAKAYSKLGRKDDARRERLLCLELAGQGDGPSANP